MVKPGDLIAGRYRIVRAIGKGGFGAVYEALDTRLNKPLALKQLTLADPALVSHFEREAKLLASLRHPGLPDVTDHFADPAGQFLVMEYVAGDDLGEQLERRGGPFPVADVLAWAEQLLDVLDYLHTREPPVIHRDIKPHNMKLGSDGRIKLLDFGLAKAGGGTRTSVRGYTLAYAAPEQIWNQGTDGRSDLYSLAVTLHALLTGTPAPPDPVSRRAAELSAEPDPLPEAQALNPLVPAHVSAGIARAAALKPELRFQSAREMRAALRNPAAAPATGPLSGRTVLVQNSTPAQSPQLQAAPTLTPFPAPAPQQAPAKKTVLINAAPSAAAKTTLVPQGGSAPGAAAATTVLEQLAPPAPPRAKASFGAQLAGCFRTVVGIALLLGAAAYATLELRPCGSLDRMLQRSPCTLDVASGGEVRGLAVTPDGAQILAGSGRMVQLWDAERGTLVRTLGEHQGLFGNQVTSVAVAPDGASAASGGQDDLVRIWRVSDAVPLQVFEGHTADVRALAYSPDGRLLASASDDRTLRLWQPGSDRTLALATLEGHQGPVTSLAFSTDGRLLVSGSDDATVRLWDVGARRLVATLQARPVLSVAFAPDGAIVAAGSDDGRVHLWRVEDGALTATIEASRGAVRGLAFTPDGATLAWGTSAGGVYFWNLATGALRRSVAVSEVHSVAVSPDDGTVISGSKDGRMRLWSSAP